MFTYTIQSVHGLQETFVVGPNGVVDKTNPAATADDKETTEQTKNQTANDKKSSR